MNPTLLSLPTLLVLGGLATAGTVTIQASHDNTLFSESASLSNGAGFHVFVGNTANGDTRRTVIRFDVAAAVPAGATITAAQLELFMTQTIVGPTDVTAHRLTASWGEGTSNAPGAEGGGTTAAANDATWAYRFFSNLNWTSAGGDYVAAPSATATVDQVGLYAWASTAALVADVQSMLDSPAGNFGWILRGDESMFPTAKRFESRQNPTVANRPRLVVDYTTGGSPGTVFCEPGVAGVIGCPCANPPSSTGRGCDNSAATGGASLAASGSASLSADTLQFSTAGELPTALSIVLQGTTPSATGLVFGEGVRCAAGSLKRLRVENAVGGGIVYPDGAETPVAAQSAILGDPIAAGTTRYYQVYYRDPALPCAGEPNFNATHGLAVLWNP